MEDRLVPVNGFLCLLQSNDVAQPVLADAGFRLAGLEVPADAAVGSVVIDGLIFHAEANHLVAAEAKQGRNIEPEQARKYGQLDAGKLVQTAYVSLRSGEIPACEAIYLCRELHAGDVRFGLTRESLDYPVIAVGRRSISLDSGGTCSPHLRKAFAAGMVAMSGPPPRLIPFDHESDEAAVRPHVLAALVSAMAQRCTELTMKGLAERATPHLAMYGRKAQGKIIDAVTKVARKIAEEDPANFQFLRRTGQRDDLVQILRNPNDLHVRGLTQSWRAVGRPGKGRRTAVRSPMDGQLDLLGELYAADNESETAEEVQE